MNTAKNNNFRISLCRLLSKQKRVAPEISYLLNFITLIIMSQNNCITFLLKLFEAPTKFAVLFLFALKRQSFHG
ncbi:hypothetical protein D3C76_1737500 [compost metagenome]